MFSEVQSSFDNLFEVNAGKNAKIVDFLYFVIAFDVICQQSNFYSTFLREAQLEWSFYC